MITKQKNVMLIRLVVGLVLCSFLFSCESESESSPELPEIPLVEVQFYHSLLEGRSGFLVITDVQGEVLYSKEFFSQDAVKAMSEKLFEGEVVNVYIVTTGGFPHHTRAYLNVKRGSYLNMTPQPIKGTMSQVKINLKNLQSFDYLTYGTDFNARTISSISDTTQNTIMTWREGGKGFAQIVKDDDGRYGFFDIDPGKEFVDLDYAALPNVSDKFKISFPEISSGHYSMATVKDGEPIHSYLFERNVHGSEATIYFPNLFEEYAQGLSFHNNDRLYTFSIVGELVNEFEFYDANAVITKGDPNDFSVSFTGNVDHYFVTFETTGGEEIIQVLAPHYVTQFQIPDFSGVISEPRYNSYKFERSRIALYDMVGIEQKPGEFDFKSSETPKGIMRRTVSFSF